MRLNNGLWLFKDRITLRASYHPTWDTPHYFLRNNGGRKANECLDINAALWRFHFSVTLWQIGGWSRLLRYWPSRYAT